MDDRSEISKSNTFPLKEIGKDLKNLEKLSI
jgi:hypothetical protein